MKQPKRLTRSQKEAVSAAYLNPNDWLLVEETDFYLRIINKESKKARMVDKFLRPKKGRTR